MGMNTLIIGAAGGIGSKLVQDLMGTSNLLLGYYNSSLNVPVESDEVDATNFNLVESYKREVLELNANQEERFLSNQFFFWSSFSSYQDYVAKYPQIKERFHMCGIGKTLDLFKEEGISVRPFLDIDSALAWVSTLS